MSQDAESPMTEATAAVAAAEPPRNAVSPGELLRRARESLNLTISDLAGQTRLSRAVLEALENNDFANLAMPVYVRGYFRKCAHVLNLPEERLLQAYADWTGTPLKPQPLPVTVSEPPREYASPRRAPSWRYALIIAVVMGAVLWWFGSGEAPRAPSTADTGVTAVALEPVPLPPTQPLPLAPAEPLTGATDAAVPPAADSQDAAAAAALAPTAETPAPAPAAEAAPAPAPVPAPPGPTTLQISIQQTSWVEIYDDNDQRLLYGLMRPGMEQSVSGKLPYSVVLGHPQGVKLALGGKAIDLAPYTSSSGTARFEVEAP
jgi:cytoskeleton protein RodZ